jgi:hypothetical protein
MSEIKENYAVDTLRDWLNQNRSAFENYKTTFEFKDSGHGSANVQLDTGAYLVDVSAWNHASCLDIQILDIKTEESIFPHVGDCASKSEFERHLAELIVWYKSNHG